MRYEVMTELLNKLDRAKRMRWVFLILGFVLGGLCVWVVV